MQKYFNKKEKAEALQAAREEYSLLKKDISNVVKAYGSYYDTKDEIFSFSMENMPQNLSQYLENYLITHGKNLSFKQFLPIFRDIVKG